MGQRHTPKKANRKTLNGTKPARAVQRTLTELANASTEPMEEKLNRATAALSFVTAAAKAAEAVRPYAEHLIDYLRHWIN